MTYLVFDARKATGYLFETRHKWLAHAFCVFTDFTRRIGLSKVVYDYDDAMCFDACTLWDASEEQSLEDWVAEQEAHWHEGYYGHA